MELDYTDKFFSVHRDAARRSAEEIVPLVIELVHPKSVVDVGCGTGTWLAVFKEQGVSDILGIDGDYVGKEMLEISEKKFVSFDLTKPLQIQRGFDLVVSLEVAEHLPIASAKLFIDSLTRLGPVVLFSAAIPSQGGTHHENEQWPDYWIELFERHEFVPIDAIRPLIWNNPKVEFWYIQNSFVFVSRRRLCQYPLLERTFADAPAVPLTVVHPRLFMERDKRLKDVLRDYDGAAAEAVRWREQSDEHRRKAVYFINEADGLKLEIAEHRKRAEDFYADAERYKTEMKALLAELTHIRFKAELPYVPIMEYLKVFPQVVRGAVRRAAQWWFGRRDRP